MNLQVDMQSASSEAAPDEDDIRSWITAALDEVGHTADCEISVRFVDAAEMAQLNGQYRGKQGPTNVLSFPAELPADLSLPLLGDIVICAPLVVSEAAEQHKSRRAHWAHLTIHGTLHLLGYDHVEDADAGVMEEIESRVLQCLGFPCPYHGALVRGDRVLERQGA